MPTHLPHDLGFLLPQEITPREQRVVLAQAVQHGVVRGHLSHPDTPIWYTWEVRVPAQPTSLPNFFLRMDRDLDWVWTPDTGAVAAILDRFAGLYRRITKTVVHVTLPGATLPLHREPVPGCQYGTGPRHSNPVRPDAPENDLHAQQGSFNIRIPITEVEGDNGCPVLEVEGQLVRYDVGRRFFALNETDVRHGTLPCGHLRGVISVSGEIDMMILNSLPRWLIPARPA